MASEELKRAVDSYEKYIANKGIDDTVIDYYTEAVKVAFSEKDIEYGLDVANKFKTHMNNIFLERSGGDFLDVEAWCCKNQTKLLPIERYYEVLKCEAPYLFESYLLYLERNRNEEERFYSPKARLLKKHGIIQAMQDLEDDKLDKLCISMCPGSQKTTTEKFFCSWIIGKYINDYSLFFSHNSDITEMFYRGVLDITTNEQEYTFQEIFPEAYLQATNAKAETINFGKYKPFASIQCSSIGAKNAGKVRTNRYLYCDDLIGGIEEALNSATLDKIWRIYSVDLKQRKLNQQVKEIVIATRWSVRDVIGRLQETYADDPRMRVIAVPDIDPETGESNFDYKYNGMSVAFFQDQALTMDEISYQCLYKNEPVERVGLLYHDEELRRFTFGEPTDVSVLKIPDREPDAIIGICDVKNKGTDFMFLPCCEQYGDDYFCVDCVCDDDTDFGVQEVKCANLIIDHNMQQCEFESNTGGDRFANDVEKRVKERGGRCNITTKPTETNKETRIIVNADWVKKHVIFLCKGEYTAKSDYGKMMSWLLRYSTSGKNVHDDIPDGWANFALKVTNRQKYRPAIITRSWI